MKDGTEMRIIFLISYLCIYTQNFSNNSRIITIKVLRKNVAVI